MIEPVTQAEDSEVERIRTEQAIVFNEEQYQRAIADPKVKQIVILGRAKAMLINGSCAGLTD